MRTPRTLIDVHDITWTLRKFSSEEPALTYGIDGTSGPTIIVRPREVETTWTRKGRPGPNCSIVLQDRYGCSPAALSIITGESYFDVKRAYAAFGWRNDDQGATNEMMVGAARLLGRDMVRAHCGQFRESSDKAIVIVPSLNLKGLAHAIAWDGKQMLDPNWGYPGRNWWGVEWAPWTIGALECWKLLPEALTEGQRRCHDLHEKQIRKEMMLMRREISRHLGEEA